MPDPITGLETEDRTQDTLDYLGARYRPQFATQPALPSVGSPGPSSGPSGPSGLGAASSASTPGGAAAPVQSSGGMDSTGAILNLVGSGLGLAKSATGVAKDITKTGVSDPRTGQLQPGAFDAAEGGGFASTSTLPPGAFDAEQGGVLEGVAPSGSLLDVAGAGLSGASLAALIAQLAESGKITPGQAIGLLQSSGGTASSLASTLGPAKAGEAGGALAGTLGPEAASLLGTAGGILGGAGAVGSIGLSLADAFKAIGRADEDPRQYSTAAGVGVGLGGGAIAGGLLGGPYGALIGAGAGGAAGDAIGQAIARNLPQTHYAALREHWGEVAADAVNNYGFGIQKAASNGGLPEIQQAMSQGYADGHVMAYLTLPDFVAQAIGVPSMTAFNGMDPTQFLMVLKAASQTDPAEYERWVGGQGDVQYLDQGRAQGVAQATQKTATATMTALIQAYKPILDQMQPIAAQELEASRQWALGGPQRDAELRGIDLTAYARSLEQAGTGSQE